MPPGVVPVLNEAPERSAAGAGADHDDGRHGPVGQAQRRTTHEYRHLTVHVDLLISLGGQKRARENERGRIRE